MEFKRLSGIYLLKTVQTVNAPIELVWDFFSKPTNLQKITPNDLDFKITSGTSDIMSQGDIITYKIQVLPLISNNWVTEISAVNHMHSFVDEQRVGPYQIWHHKHSFKADGQKTRMTDEVYFRLPFEPFSKILFNLYIRKKLTKIFTHRTLVIEELFNN